MPQLAEYNSPLTTEQAMKFNAWRKRLPPDLQNMEDYDLQGAFLDQQQQSANAHMSDKFKKPNHITFSNESIYSTPQHPGGQWNEDSYTPSQFVLKNHPAPQLQQYFRQYEPDARLVLPQVLKQVRRR